MRYLSLIILLFSSVVLSAQQAIIKADSSSYLIGDWINISVEVNPEGSEILWQVPSKTWSELDVLEMSEIDTLLEGEITLLKQQYKLIAFDTGLIEIEPFYFLIGEDTVRSNPLLVQINGIELDSAATEIKPIKGPLDAPFKLKEILPHILITLGAILLLLLLFFLYKKFKKPKVEKAAAPKIIIPPHIWAKEELIKLEQEKVWQEGNVKGYYSRLTDILKTYIELRYKTPAVESTTDEVISDLNRRIGKNESVEQLSYLLRTADLAKFAKSKPIDTDNEHCMKIARDFIKSTQQDDEVITENQNIKDK